LTTTQFAAAVAGVDVGQFGVVGFDVGSPVPVERKKSGLGNTSNDGVLFGSAFTKWSSCSTSGSAAYCATV
jgi:hypothetical protein